MAMLKGRGVSALELASHRIGSLFEPRSTAMQIGQFIRKDVALSALAHLSLLALVLFSTEVHPFSSVTNRPIMVDIVTANAVAKKPQSDAKPQVPTPDWASLAQQNAAAAAKEAAAPSQPPPVRTEKPQAGTRPDLASAAPKDVTARAHPASVSPEKQDAGTHPQSASAAPASSLGYTPAQPDLTVKYHVMLGLPEALPPSDFAAKPDGSVGATPSSTADIAAKLVAEFRRHLRTCSKLPASVTPSDDVMIKLRVAMTPQATLAARPVLIEGTASIKGLELEKSAVKALAACQPYRMLPADRYSEWRVLDLTFTPRDFTS